MRHPDWTGTAEATWQTLSPSEQEQVSRAVDRYAKNGEGDIEYASKEDGTGRLYVGQFVVMFALAPEDESMTVEVLWIYRLPQ